MATKSKRPGDRRGAILAGGAAGAAAAVLGYALTFALVGGRAGREFGDAVPTWKVVGWYDYNAHFVDVVSSRAAGPFGDSTAVNLVAESSGTTAALLYAVPPLVLLCAGAVVAWRLGGADLGTVLAGGAGTVLGYGPLAVAGALAVAHTVSGSFLGLSVSATVAVPLGPAVVVAGLLYPAVFGSLGALVGSAVRRRVAVGGPAGA